MPLLREFTNLFSLLLHVLLFSCTFSYFFVKSPGRQFVVPGDLRHRHRSHCCWCWCCLYCDLQKENKAIQGRPVSQKRKKYHFCFFISVEDV